MEQAPFPAAAGVVRVTAEAELPAPAEQVWELLTERPTPPALCEHTTVLETLLPRTPGRGEVELTVHRHEDGTHCTSAGETIEVVPGRRVRSRLLWPGSPEHTLEVEPRGTGCVVRLEAVQPEVGAEDVQEIWESTFARYLWRLRRHLGDPTTPAEAPPRSPSDLARVERRTAMLQAYRAGDLVDVSAGARRRLLVPAPSVWRLLADPASGLPGMFGPRQPVPGSDGVGQRWVTIGDTGCGVRVVVQEVAELVQDRRLVTTTPFEHPGVTLTVEMTPRAFGCRLDVQLSTRAPQGASGAAWFRMWHGARRYAADVARGVARGALTGVRPAG